MSLDGIEKTLNHLHARYLSIDAKLDAIAKRAATSKWTALLFGAWTLFAFWLGTKF